MRRIAAAICCFAVLPTSALATGSRRSWAQPQVKLVTRAGIFSSTPATFAPAESLTEGALAGAVGRLTGSTPPAVASPAAPVTMERLDASLVHALGLADAAYLFGRGASQAGLNPPHRFGTEAVARLLGLRLDHPAGQENLELQPQDTATRAEAAYSLAQILAFHAPGQSYAPASVRSGSSAEVELPDFAQSWEVGQAKSAAVSFTLPELTDWQRRILTTAVSYIGFPYVWGGTLDHAIGFDCSGLVWQVYKLTQYPDEGGLAGALRGRTTMEMSGEVARNKRIHLADLEPGDVLFFGRGPHSKPKEVDHAGIYLGNGWFIHSSAYGVAVAQLDGSYRTSFAWARRPLAEAALELADAVGTSLALANQR